MNQIVINEIIYNGPTSGTDPDEFIGLYNAGVTSFDFGEAYFTQGFTFEFLVGTSLAAGEYLVLTNNQAGFTASFGFTADFQWTSGSLSNDCEDLAILQSGWS
jgi:hypothetical protein